MPASQPKSPIGKKAPTPPKLSEAWLAAFYTEVGREVSLARNSQRETHNWVITLSVGAVAAIWALGGGEFKYPSESSFVVALVMIPIVFRFFVRGCLEYQIFHRWICLRDALNAYFFARDVKSNLKDMAMAALIDQIRLYYFQWQQPRSNHKMIWDNLVLAYGWPMLLLAALVAFGFAYQPLTHLVAITLALVGPWMVFEVLSFHAYFHGRYKQPVRKINIRAL